MRRLLPGCLLLSFASFALGQSDIPLTNWTVPPYATSARGIQTMTDISGPRAFIPIQPCRVVDTRGGGVFTGDYGPPALSVAQARTFDIDSAPHCPGFPAAVDGYSLNFTVTQTAGAPGDLRAWPTGSPPPPTAITSVLNWTVGNATLANATIMPAGTAGAIDVVVAGADTHLLIDINGYFSAFWSSTDSFRAYNSSNFPTAAIHNGNSFCGISVSNPAGACGLQVTQTTGGFGSGRAIVGQRPGGAGTGNDAAGVFGSVGECHPAVSYDGAGVRGEGCASGVAGIARVVAVGGSLTDGSGNVLVEGYLGYNPTFTTTNYGVWSTANYGGGGAKFFVEPHPTDASKVIRYISLEGPEPGTYFRGRGKFERGMARIRVPEDFGMVTDEDGLTVQITPIGGMASVAVLRADLNEVVVQSSRNVEFYYMVNGIRRTHKHLTSPIGEGGEYMPKSADATMPLYLTDGQKQLLIQNGTYRADGAVNMETARRLGWDRIWAERERPVPAPSPE